MAGATRSPGMAMLHDERFVCTGFLCKRNSKPWKLLRKWDKRWFALDEQALVYCRCPGESAPRQAFPLLDILEVRMLDEVHRKGHTNYEFELLLPGRTLRLRPKSESQRAHWVEAIECQRARALSAGAVTGGSLEGTRAPSASTEAGAPVGRRAALRERLSERSLRGKHEHRHSGGDSANESAEYGGTRDDDEALDGSGNDRSDGAAVDLSPRHYAGDSSVYITRSECSWKKIGLRVLSHSLLPSRSAVVSPTASPSAACSPSPSKSSSSQALREYNDYRRRSLTAMVESESGGDFDGTTRSSSVSMRIALFGIDTSAPTTPTHSKEEDRQADWVFPIVALG